MVSFFCVLAPEGMNAIVFGEGWGRRQNVAAYSDAIFTMLNLFSSFTDDKIISLYTIHLSLSCCNISFFSKRMSYVI